MWRQLIISFNYRLRNPGLIIPKFLWLRAMKKVYFSFVLLVTLLCALFCPGSRSRSYPYLGHGCAHSKGKREIMKTWGIPKALTWKWHHDFHLILWIKTNHMARSDIRGTGNKILPLEGSANIWEQNLQIYRYSLIIGEMWMGPVETEVGKKRKIKMSLGMKIEAPGHQLGCY